MDGMTSLAIAAAMNSSAAARSNAPPVKVIPYGYGRQIPMVTPPSSSRPITSHQAVKVCQVRFLLQRPPQATTWGLSLSKFDDSCLIVGAVDTELVASFTRYTAPCWFGTAVSYVQNLQVGDAIRSINGRPIAAFGESFDNIIRFLRDSNDVSFLVARMDRVPQSFLQVTRGQPQLSFKVAQEAFTLIQPQLQKLTPLTVMRSVMTKPSFQIKKVIKMPAQVTPKPSPKPLPFILFTNPMFRGEDGIAIQYADDVEFNPEDGERAHLFLPKIESFPDWLAQRKKTWRKNYNVYKLEDYVNDDEDDAPSSNVAKEFWIECGYPSFQDWLALKTSTWKRSYSWNQRKRKQIEEEVEEVVQFPISFGEEGASEFSEWLRVRKRQWLVMSRKRKRVKLNEDRQTTDGLNPGDNALPLMNQCPPTNRQTSEDIRLIDSFLEEKERKQRAHQQTFDLAFLFDAKIGAPDDVVAHCMRFLHPSEHGKLLCISLEYSNAIKEREDMWRQLCPKHWTLPRRPRKRWHDLYITKIRLEEANSRKRSDDVLIRIGNILFKGDYLHKLEKLVAETEKKFDFDVNYASGVVAERNSTLNLAVIHGRHKVVRWLVETKGAQLESADRGNFTPLLNAAWAGDKYLVRYLLSKGCDRSTIGTCHYTKPLGLPDFKGLNAEGWARRKGHHEIAELIRKGI